MGYDERIDLSKVDHPSMKEWIRSTLSSLIPDDEIIIEYTYELLFASDDPDISSLKQNLSPFLDDKTLNFCKKLYKLLILAQSSPDGIPTHLKKKKDEPELVIPMKSTQEKIPYSQYKEKFDSNTSKNERSSKSYNQRTGRNLRDRTNFNSNSSRYNSSSNTSSKTASSKTSESNSLSQRVQKPIKKGKYNVLSEEKNQISEKQKLNLLESLK